MPSDAVIFDLGGVVLSWDPRRAYERVLPAEEVATFLERVDFAGWNRLNDGGRSFEEAEQELIARFHRDRLPMLVEDLGHGAYPHCFAELKPADVLRTHDLPLDQ